MSIPGGNGRRFPWATFWTADGSIGTVAAIVVSVMVGGSGSSGGGGSTPTPSSPPALLTPPIPSAPTEAAPAAPPQDSTSAEFALRDSLNSSTFRDCNPLHNITYAGMRAALGCQTVFGGPDRKPLIVQFASGDDLKAAMALEASSVANPHGVCAVGQDYVGVWNQPNGPPLGDSVCRSSAQWPCV
jgi:hypothetical protein